MRRSMRGQRPLFEGTSGFCICLLFLAQACCVLTGCGDQIRAPTTEELGQFEAAVPTGPAVDVDRITQARMAVGPYRVVPGDVLQVEMPRVLDPQALEAAVAAGGRQTYLCRVNEQGTIVLPIVGPFPVAGQSLSQIESAVIAEYYPKFVKTPLPIYVSVEEYKTHRVSIVGAVAKPGIYALRHDQMSLVALLMEAGGIAQEGAAVIRIVRAGPNLVSPVGTQGATLTGLPRTAALPAPQSAGWQTAGQGRLVASLPAPAEDRMPVGAWPSTTPGQEAAASLVLPVRGLNIPFADVTLTPGDRVVVERPAEQCIAIVGLVNRPGNMPCPPDTQHTLIQAIAFAGGLDLIADPRYVSIYRLRPDGEVMSVTLELVNLKRQGQLTETLALPLRPGDVVSVEHTPRTRTNVFFDRVFRISLGLYFSPEDFWNND